MLRMSCGVRGLGWLLALWCVIPGTRASAQQRLGTLKVSQKLPIGSSEFILNGGGRVTSEPPGIDCLYTINLPTTKAPTLSGTCEYQFPLGSDVELLATPEDSTSENVDWASRQKGVRMRDGETAGSDVAYRCLLTGSCIVHLDRFKTEVLVSFGLKRLHYTIDNLDKSLGHVRQLGEGAYTSLSIYCGNPPSHKQLCDNWDYYGQDVGFALVPNHPAKGVLRLEKCRTIGKQPPILASAACFLRLDFPEMVVTVEWWK